MVANGLSGRRLEKRIHRIKCCSNRLASVKFFFILLIVSTRAEEPLAQGVMQISKLSLVDIFRAPLKQPLFELIGVNHVGTEQTIKDFRHTALLCAVVVVDARFPHVRVVLTNVAEHTNIVTAKHAARLRLGPTLIVFGHILILELFPPLCATFALDSCSASEVVAVDVMDGK